MGEDSVSDVGSTPSASTKKQKSPSQDGLFASYVEMEEGVEPERVGALSKQSGGMFAAAIAKKLCFEQVVCKQSLLTVTPSASTKFPSKPKGLLGFF